MSTAVAPANERKHLTIKDHLKSPEFVAELGRVLPSHLKPERMARVALTAITRVPKLLECDQPTFFQCLLSLSQWGLEPDGRRAHLIPYKNKQKTKQAGHDVYDCQLVIDFKGIAELCFRSGNVNAIHADVVRRGDEFAYSAGYVTKHTPWFLRDPATRPAEAGDIYAVYCVVQMKEGAAKHDVMSVEEVNAIRDKSQGYYAYKQGWASTSPWVDYWNEMAKKTVFRRCSKWLPWSAEVHDAMSRDDLAIDVESRPTAPLTIPKSNTLEALTAELTAEQPEPEGQTLTPDESQAEPLDTTDPLLQYEARIAEATGTAVLDKILDDSTKGNLTAAQMGQVATWVDKRRAELKPKGQKSFT